MPTDHLDRRTAKQLAGVCCYGACQERALDGSDYCAPHDAHERGRARAKAARRRLRLIKAGICIVDGCGAKVGKRPRGARGAGKPYRRCMDCVRKDRAAKARVPVDSARVPDKEPKTKIEIHADGYARIRTVGRGVRGQKSRAELDDDLRQDLTDAIAQVAAVRDSGIAQLRLPQVADLGRIAKREAQSIVADRLLTAKRALEAVAESLCPGRLAEMDRVRREAVDEE